jgi:putative hydrolase of the HAD superfamily
VIKAIIFDCFGVLIGRGFSETYRLAGGDPVKDAEFLTDVLGQASMGLISHSQFHAQIAEKLHITPDEFVAAQARAELPNEELLSYIGELHKTYKTAVLSNANRGSLDRRFGRERLNSLFDAVVVSAEVGMVKPDPAVYKLTADRLGVPLSECVFTDDQAGYCEAAGALGMPSITYRNFEQFKADLKEILAK